jgi:uncharacterized protein (TIGR02145 family)
MLYALLLLSCSSGNEQNPPNSETAKYCVYQDTQKCYSTTQTTCPAGGELGDFCPYGSSNVVNSSPSVPSSSSTTSNPNPNIVYGTSVTHGSETYKTVVIGSQTWFQRNLNVFAEGSRCYKDDPANCTTYGRLYDWQTATTLCPSGWRLPSNADWDKLFHYVDGTSGTQPGAESPYKSPTAGRYLRATSGWNMCGNGSSYTYKCEDTFGFSALPGGYFSVSKEEFGSVGSRGYWWSSSEHDKYNGQVYILGMRYDDEKISYSDRDPQQEMLSVRCVKN